MKSIENCIVRETKEEIGIEIKKMKKIGVSHFFFKNKEEFNQDVHLFLIEDWIGEIIETEEIKPFWFDLKQIPYDKMWTDDKIWLPRILSGEEFIEYNFFFDGVNGKMLDYEKIV